MYLGIDMYNSIPGCMYKQLIKKRAWNWKIDIRIIWKQLEGGMGYGKWCNYNFNKGNVNGIFDRGRERMSLNSHKP